MSKIDIQAIKTYYGEVYDEVQAGGAYSIVGVPGQDYLDHVDALLAALDERDAEIAKLRERNLALVCDNAEAQVIRKDNAQWLQLLATVRPMYGPLHNCRVCGADPQMGDRHLDWCPWFEQEAPDAH